MRKTSFDSVPEPAFQTLGEGDVGSVEIDFDTWVMLGGE